MVKNSSNLPVLALLLAGFIFLNTGCRHDPTEIPCNGTMFGQPIAATGLDSTRCKPSCACKNFSSRSFTEQQLSSLKSWQLTQPFEELTYNPYNEPPPDKDSAVCAVVIEDLANKLYHLQNFPDADAAKAAGAIVTHYDACGLCSTLSDFAVYAKELDIGAPVRQCALANFSKPFDSLVVCIEALGFTRPCAQIWAYNARNTQAKCLQPCLEAANTPYNLPDGSLNECLQCDEQQSGPVFKAVAGRTRRNTGVASSICRFCEEVQVVEHNYPF
ncbi:hypothetical protein C7N43_20820 [Sphingobacteriales bacterium UPWRP_1]|nr:hypothetical protein B6N25_01725 [Sphingobacteriales bacterium TSM_CSS]PSJ75087.1 hypothetical protein C7N43_20820 [Sphingobacteriales bacterium UPWRP_1]